MSNCNTLCFIKNPLQKETSNNLLVMKNPTAKHCTWFYMNYIKFDENKTKHNDPLL